jgi:hypothetical protein
LGGWQVCGGAQPFDESGDETRHVIEREPERARTTVGLPEAQHHDVRLGVPSQPQRAGLTARIEENLAPNGKSDHLGLLHEQKVAAISLAEKWN